jgi:hypothetical protein
VDKEERRARFERKRSHKKRDKYRRKKKHFRNESLVPHPGVWDKWHDPQEEGDDK